MGSHALTRCTSLAHLSGKSSSVVLIGVTELTGTRYGRNPRTDSSLRYKMEKFLKYTCTTCSSIGKVGGGWIVTIALKKDVIVEKFGFDGDGSRFPLHDSCKAP